MARVSLVGRLQHLSLTADDLTFTLRSRFHGASIDYRCHSRRPEIIKAAAALEPGQLVGIIGVAPDRTDNEEPTGFSIEYLEILGRAVEEVKA